MSFCDVSRISCVRSGGRFGWRHSLDVRRAAPNLHADGVVDLKGTQSTRRPHVERWKGTLQIRTARSSRGTVKDQDGSSISWILQSVSPIKAMINSVKIKDNNPVKQLRKSRKTGQRGGSTFTDDRCFACVHLTLSSTVYMELVLHTEEPTHTLKITPRLNVHNAVVLPDCGRAAGWW